MEATLEYLGNVLKISDFRHDEKAELISPWNCSFSLRVVSGQFGGFMSGCMIDYQKLQLFIRQLNDLICGKRKHVLLKDIECGAMIHFHGDGFGHIEVSGHIGSGFEQSLKFAFETDQTAYPPFINALKQF